MSLQTPPVADANAAAERLDSAVSFATTMRPHIALAVSDLEASLRFYRTLFVAEPVKQKPGYAKFELAEPPLNISFHQTKNVQPQSGPAHFGVQVKSIARVQAAVARFQAAGFATEVEEQTTCCYAVQDKVWVQDPDGVRWEVFVVLDADASTHSGPENAQAPDCCEPTDPPCCTPSSREEAVVKTGCCG